MNNKKIRIVYHDLQMVTGALFGALLLVMLLKIANITSLNYVMCLCTLVISGGAVLAGQSIGRSAWDKIGKARGQRIIYALVFSIKLAAIVLAVGVPVFRILFEGREEMMLCVTYLQVIAYTCPIIAVYSAGIMEC